MTKEELKRIAHSIDGKVCRLTLGSIPPNKPLLTPVMEGRCYPNVPSYVTIVLHDGAGRTVPINLIKRLDLLPEVV